MYCKFLKLINGDNLIVTTDDECKSFKDKEFLNCVDPVQVGTVRYPRGTMVVESYVLQPWIKMSVDDVVQIPVSSIVVAVDVQELAFKQYTKYLESMDELNSFEEELIELGDDPEAFEDFITSVLGSDNEEEEDDRIGRADTRTLH
jgi:hypothetical protein